MLPPFMSKEDAAALTAFAHTLFEQDLFAEGTVHTNTSSYYYFTFPERVVFENEDPRAPAEFIVENPNKKD